MTKMKKFYISFVNDEKFVGGCFIREYNIESAIFKTHLLGINPGGEAMVLMLSKKANVRNDLYDRLLSLEDMSSYKLRPIKANNTMVSQQNNTMH